MTTPARLLPATILAAPSGVHDRQAAVLVAVLLSFAIACQPGDAPPSDTSSITDSAGIRIIENHRPPEGSRLGWRIGSEPTASIGDVEGAEPYLLHQARDAVRLSGGRILVANFGTAEVRAFDADGMHLVTFGGRGEGPGEFMSLWRVAAWPGDSIMAWDLSGRYAVFDSDGHYGRSFVLDTNGDAPSGRAEPVAVRRDGTIVAMFGAYTDTAVVELRDGEGRMTVSLGAHPHGEIMRALDGGGYTEPMPVAYSRELVTSLWGDLIVVSPNDRYEIRAYRADGTLSLIVRRQHDPRAPAEADSKIYVERRMAEFGSSRDRTGQPPPADVLASVREMLQSVPLAATFPAFSTILTDDAGHLWVREYDFPREERPAPLWTVFDPEGRVLGFIETPADLRIHQIGEDYILGHTRDELGVESIQLWPLERGGTGA